MSDKVPVVMLTSKNYQRWSYDIKQTLGSKELWEIVTGEETINPDESKVKERKEWRKKDFSAKAVIGRSLDDQHHAFVRSCDTAKDMWEKLKRINQSGVEWNVDQVSNEYNLLKFAPGMTVNAYFSELSVILQRLETAGEKVSERLVMSKVLTDLPPEYTSLKQSWRLMATQNKDKMTLDELQAQLNALEKESDAEVLQETGPSKAFTVNSGKPGNGRFKKRNKQFTGKCFHCDKPGHVKKDCPGLKDKDGGSQEKGKRGKAFMARTMKDLDMDKITSRVLRESHGPHLHMCGDSGASFPLTSKKHLLQDYETLHEPIELLIGDGRCVLVTGKGTLEVEVFDGQSWQPGTLTPVMYCKELGDTDLFKPQCCIQEVPGGDARRSSTDRRTGWQ